jgi:hypothetical protein
MRILRVFIYFALTAVLGTDALAQGKPVPVQTPYDDEYNKFVDQWSMCFEVVDSVESVTVGLGHCRSALSFARLTPHDRSLLSNRITDLTNKLVAVRPPISTAPSSAQYPDYEAYTRERRLCFDPATSTYDAITSCGSALLLWDPSPDDLQKLHERRGQLLDKIADPSKPGSTDPFGPIGIAITNVQTLPGPDWMTSAFIVSVIAATMIAWLIMRRSNVSVTQAGGNIILPNSPPGSLSGDLLVRSPSEAMAIKLRRSQRISFTGRIIFMLDARIDLNAEEYSLIRKYRLGAFCVYDSKSRAKRAEATRAHLEMTRDQAPLSADAKTQFLSAGKVLYRLGRASVSAALAALSLRIRINTLIRGVHIECKSMDELLAAESVIVEAGRNLKAYLETAATFDGREEIIELR